MKYFLLPLILFASLAHARTPAYQLSSDLSVHLINFFAKQPSIIGGGSQGSYYYSVDIECAYENGLGKLEDCYARQHNGFTRNIQAPIKMDFWDENYNDQATVLIQEFRANLGEEGLIANGLSGYQVTLLCSFRQRAESFPISNIECTFSKMD